MRRQLPLIERTLTCERMCSMSCVLDFAKGAASLIILSLKPYVAFLLLLAPRHASISADRFKELCIDGGIQLNDERLQELFNEVR